ncbi:hypothetical protein SAMN04487943_101631 [Gracilibacillus orientalis]|uniref:Uncharacterized protein n=1 Tax=Gracilibacillus orientalis TaxID=334253 RepID=A0A1I4HSZ1_9BACI|nr:hypothetical protein [Gracilibacillus orientalis]SFL45368.1 hypothetical protein SAMN04487943_101631 [Gracilibacillus orientalis]
MASVTKKFSKGERKLVKINIGTMIKNTHVNRPEMVILCSVPHLLHSIGLYDQTKEL